MQVRARFLRTHDGVTSFARITLRARQSEAWSIAWHDATVEDRQLYGAAVERGIRDAAAGHGARGGAPHAVEVIAVEHTVVDTRADAVTCCATIATWRALGRAEDEVVIERRDSAWRASIPSTSSS